MRPKKCTCILPFYNESDRIIDVLRILTQVSNLDKIICIDDGSTDTSSEKVKKFFPSIQVIRIVENQGKSAAVARGLALTNTEYVLLMDADLYNLQKEEIEEGISVVLKQSEIDMIIFRRKNDPWLSKVVRGDVLVSGERILRTEDLLNIFKTKMVAYQIEPAINYYMQEANKNVYWMLHSGTNVMKIKKVGLVRGTLRELKYYYSVMTYKGPLKYFNNMATFCHQEAIS